MSVCVGLLLALGALAEEKDLFNGKDLTGFKQAKGAWKVADGAIVNEVDPANGSRLETEQSFGDFELTGKIMVENNRNCELQVHSYGQVFQVNLEKGAWADLKIVAKGADVKVTVNGQDFAFDKNEGKPDSKEGLLAFYVPKGGQLKIKDLKIKTEK
jgi:hypothetical protein